MIVEAIASFDCAKFAHDETARGNFVTTPRDDLSRFRPPMTLLLSCNGRGVGRKLPRS